MMKTLQSIAQVLGWLSMIAMVLVAVYAIIKCCRWYKKEVIDHVDNQIKEVDVREMSELVYSDFFED